MAARISAEMAQQAHQFATDLATLARQGRVPRESSSHVAEWPPKSFEPSADRFVAHERNVTAVALENPGDSVLVHIDLDGTLQADHKLLTGPKAHQRNPNYLQTLTPTEITSLVTRVEKAITKVGDNLKQHMKTHIHPGASQAVTTLGDDIARATESGTISRDTRTNATVWPPQALPVDGITTAQFVREANGKNLIMLRRPGQHELVIFAGQDEITGFAQTGAAQVLKCNPIPSSPNPTLVEQAIKTLRDAFAQRTT